eukprot:6214836-Pleurochrysis_carterae.AAC.1
MASWTLLLSLSLLVLPQAEAWTGSAARGATERALKDKTRAHGAKRTTLPGIGYSAALDVEPRVRHGPQMAGMKKQAELAALMQKAKLQKQGLAEDEIEAVVDVPKPPTKSKPKPLQQKRRAPTREELFAMVRKTAKQGSEPSKRAAVPMPRTRPAEPDRGLPLRRPGPPPFGSSPAEGYNDLKQALSGASGPSFDVSDEVLPAGRLLPMPASLSLLPCEPFGVASLGALAGDAPTLVLIASNEAMMSNKLRETLMSFAGRFNAKELDAAVAGVSRVPPSGVRKLARKGGVSYPLVSDEGRAWLGSLRVPASGAPCAFVVEVATGRVVASFGTENAQARAERAET